MAQDNDVQDLDDVFPSLRLSDIRTPDGASLYSECEAESSDHERTFGPTTAAAKWELGDQYHQQAPTVPLDKGASELKQDVHDLKKENHLLRQKLHQLQRNANLKQVALIGTVISWFGEKGLLDDDGEDTAQRLASLMMSARATEQLVRSAAEICQQVLKSNAINVNDISTAAANEREVEKDETSRWLSGSLGSSFNPPFSSSRKGKKDSAHVKDNVAPQADSEGNHEQILNCQKAKNHTRVAFDEGVYRLDTRLRRIQKAAEELDDRRLETRCNITRLRQNAIKRFRIWKAISTSRDSAANQVPREANNVYYNAHPRLTPTPLTQYSMEKGTSSVSRIFDPNQTILGEIAFQVERRILALVFQREQILYGYNLGNLDLVIRTYLDQGSRSSLQHRYDLIMDVLRGYGWMRGRHPQFVADMIKSHGTFQDVETSRAEAMKRGWSNPSELKRGVLCICPVRDVLDMLVILDCLLHMARNDELPVFLW